MLFPEARPGRNRRQCLYGLTLLCAFLASSGSGRGGVLAFPDGDANPDPSTHVPPLNHRDLVYYAYQLHTPSTLNRREGLHLAREVSSILEMRDTWPLGSIDGWYVGSRPRTPEDGPPDADAYAASLQAAEEEEEEQLPGGNSPLSRRSINKRSYQDPVLELFAFIKRSAELYPNTLHRRWVDTAQSVRLLRRQVMRQRFKRAPTPEAAPPVPVGQNQPADPLVPIEKFLAIADPLFPEQWHLRNDEDKLHDLNVTELWREGITGKGIRVGMIDDGLDYTSLDLKDNFDLEGSYDFNNHTKYPTPTTPEDYHGTRCAGEIAAVKNGICGLGIAYDAKISGLRILSGVITDVDEALSLNYNFQKTSIYSCSWGPADDGKAMEAPNELILDAMINGIQKGRGGLGSIFVFATGNGGYFSDNCNFDGYTNSIYTISVGAIDHMERHPYYSEPCSAQLVVAYSSGSGKYITTTDRGLNQCTDRHGGTSAAAPLVSGVLALVLQVRPELTWRDMQHLVLQNAVPFSLDDDGWQKVANGRLYNHKYGYGKMDGWALVQAAKTFKMVNEQTWYEADTIVVNEPIPQGPKGIESSITITQANLDESYFKRLEHITVIVNIDHEYRGDVEVHLTSPNNYVSRLATPRPLDQSKKGFQQWTFMSVKHWDEDPLGTWTLRVIDDTHRQFTGVVRAWTMIMWGEATDESVKSPKGGFELPKPIASPLHPIVLPESVSAAQPSSSTEQVADGIITATETQSVPSISSGVQDGESQTGAAPGSATGLADGASEDRTSSSSHASALGVLIGLILALILSAGVYLVRRWIQSRRPSTDSYEFAPLSNTDHDGAGDVSGVAGSGDPRSRFVQHESEEGHSLVSHGQQGVAYRDYDDDYDHPARQFTATRDMYDAFGEDDEEDDEATLNQNGNSSRPQSNPLLDGGDAGQPRSGSNGASKLPSPTPITGHEEGQVLFEISSDVDDEEGNGDIRTARNS